MTPIRFIETPAAPKAIGPYSQAVRCGNWLFISGQIAIDPKSGIAMKSGTSITAQCEQIFANMRAILAAAELGFHDVAKTTVYLSDMRHFEAMNMAYSQCFGAHRPARATVAVAGLPAGVDVEIEAIALYR